MAVDHDLCIYHTKLGQWPSGIFFGDPYTLLEGNQWVVANIGGRWGGSISAAWFLREFAGDTPWVHLDIAGTAWLDEAKPYMAKGPSGVAVRTFARLAMDW